MKLLHATIIQSHFISCFTLFTKICLLNFLVPSYIISCHNCGHGTDLRGCPQAPLSIEGMHSLYQLTYSQYSLEFLIQFILANSWVDNLHVQFVICDIFRITFGNIFHLLPEWVPNSNGLFEHLHSIFYICLFVYFLSFFLSFFLEKGIFFFAGGGGGCFH